MDERNREKGNEGGMKEGNIAADKLLRKNGPAGYVYVYICSRGKRRGGNQLRAKNRV